FLDDVASHLCCQGLDGTHETCPRDALGASRKDARENGVTRRAWEASCRWGREQRSRRSTPGRCHSVVATPLVVGGSRRRGRGCGAVDMHEGIGDLDGFESEVKSVELRLTWVDAFGGIQSISAGLDQVLFCYGRRGDGRVVTRGAPTRRGRICFAGRGKPDSCFHG